MTTRCNAHNRKGEPCKAYAIVGRTKCKNHGGLTPRGAASPHFKTGRYSKDLPTRLAARMQDALTDPKLLDLTEDVALLQARLGEVLEQTERGDVAALWMKVKAAYDDLVAASQSGDTKAVAAASRALGSAITQGVGEVQRWQEVYKLLNQKAKLSREQQKAMVEAQQTVNVEQVMAFVTAVVSIIREEVGLGEVQQRIARRMEKLMHAGTVIEVSADDS